VRLRNPAVSFEIFINMRPSEERKRSAARPLNSSHIPVTMVKRSRTKTNFASSVPRFLLDVLKPSPAVVAEQNIHAESREPQRQPARMVEESAVRSACIALQNEDQDEDAIVITALNVIPFCCHADLLLMSRTELLAVADILNGKLPGVLKIDVGPSRSDAYIRNSIELLVGLRRDVPQAPKPVRSHSISTQARILESPRSPLATKNKYILSVGTPQAALAVLREEDEEVSAAQRPQKRRRYNAESPSSATAPFDPARRVTRSQSHRVAPKNMDLAAKSSTRVLRTRSQKLPERKPMLQGIHPNITITRGRSGSRGAFYQRSKSAVLTSTPKKRRILGDANADSSAVSTAAVSTGKSTSFGDKVARPKADQCDLRRKHSADLTDVTFGIDGMTLPAITTSSDMDISTD